MGDGGDIRVSVCVGSGGGADARAGECVGGCCFWVGAVGRVSVVWVAMRCGLGGSECGMVDKQWVATSNGPRDQTLNFMIMKTTFRLRFDLWSFIGLFSISECLELLT